MTIQTSLSYKILPPAHDSSGKHPALIMLHGRGADENDLLGLAEYLDERLFILSARGPFPFEWGGGYTWYEILEVGRPEPRMFDESYARLSQFLEDVIKNYPVDPKRIFFLGFSMGTVMSHVMLLTKPELVAGVVANSGYVPEGTGVTFHWDKLRGKSIFVAHGTDDPVIPVQFGRRSKELYEKTAVNMIYKEYPMAHQIGEQSLNDFSGWLRQHIDGRD